jgi:hypothetical protein
MQQNTGLYISLVRHCPKVKNERSLRRSNYLKQAGTVSLVHLMEAQVHPVRSEVRLSCLVSVADGGQGIDSRQ